MRWRDVQHFSADAQLKLSRGFGKKIGRWNIGRLHRHPIATNPGVVRKNQHPAGLTPLKAALLATPLNISLNRLGEDQSITNHLPQITPRRLRRPGDDSQERQTIDVMARSLQKTPIFSKDLSEYGFEIDRDAPLDYVQDLMDRGVPAIVCSHNPIIPKVVKKLVGKKYFKSMDRELEPAQAIVLHCRAGEVVACDWIDEPLI